MEKTRSSIFLFYFYRTKQQNMKKLTISIFLLFLSLFGLHAQNSKEQILIDEGIVLHDSAQYKAAIDKFKQALIMNPSSAYATYEIALSYLKLKEYENASRYSTWVINVNDKELAVGAYAIKSEALAEMDKIDEAIVLLEEGLTKNPNNDLLLFNLALNYYKKDDLTNTLENVQKAIDVNKSNAAAYLLNAYALNDSKLWVQGILSYQMYLLIEPNAARSKDAFDELLQLMCIKPVSSNPTGRSFTKQQLSNSEMKVATTPTTIPPLSFEDGLNRNLVYQAIKSTMDSLNTAKQNSPFIVFKEVNKSIISLLEKENNGIKNGVLWTFYVPFFSTIANSEYYETYCRYISATYFPESLEWWNKHPEEAQKFISWFEHGDDNSK